MFAGYCIFNNCHGYIKTPPVTSIAAGFAVPEVVLPFLIFLLAAVYQKLVTVSTATCISISSSNCWSWIGCCMRKNKSTAQKLILTTLFSKLDKEHNNDLSLFTEQTCLNRFKTQMWWHWCPMCIDIVSLPGCTVFRLWVDNAGMGNIDRGRGVGLSVPCCFYTLSYAFLHYLTYIYHSTYKI